MRVSGTTRPVEGYMLKELILEGQNRYFDSEPCREYGLPDPELIDFDGDFRVNMYRKFLQSENQVTEKVTEVTEKIDPELLAKVMANLEMRALLSSLARTMK